MNEQLKNVLSGFNYFTDIEDLELRIRNTAVFAANLFEDNFDTDKNDLTNKGKFIIITYWNNVDESIRKEVYAKFLVFLTERGFMRKVQVH